MPLKNFLLTLGLIFAPGAMAAEMSMPTDPIVQTDATAPTPATPTETPETEVTTELQAPSEPTATPDTNATTQPTDEVAAAVPSSSPEVPAEQAAATSPLDPRIAELEGQLAQEVTLRTELAAQHATALAELEGKHTAALAELEAKHVDATKQLRQDLRDSKFERVLDKVDVRDEHRGDVKGLLPELDDPASDAGRAKIDEFLASRPLWKKPADTSSSSKMPAGGGSTPTKLGTFAGKDGSALGGIRVTIGGG